jgi:hypothetical protein
MALLNDELSLWEIAFRWAGHEPDRLWLRIPLPARDNFRTLMDAILNGRLDCFSLSLDKWHPDTSNGFGPEYFIRHYIDDVYACVWGKKYDRKLLKWAAIERWAMQQWCERQGVPLPEFWFPPGWKLDYEWPRDDEDQGATPALGDAAVQESIEERSSRLNKHHRAKLACQQVASAIWSKEPGLTIKEVACKWEVQELAGGSQYELETVQAWVGEVDPRSAARKRGRKRKNNAGLADSNN